MLKCSAETVMLVSGEYLQLNHVSINDLISIYLGRSFIQPSMRLRRLAVAKKFGPLAQNFAGKSIILIDDSIVRGTTIGQLIRLLKDAGMSDIHSFIHLFVSRIK